jgi:hypothetical protein
MTPTTKLEAVNIMLSTIGEQPVNSLSSGLVDAELAETILSSTSRSVQSEGWHFNREFKMSFTANTAGEVILPSNVLRADATLSYDSKDLVQRGSKMYDKKNHTFNIGETVDLDVVVELQFEDLPEVAKRYITIRAGRIFQDRVVGSDTLHGFTREDEAGALFSLKEFEADTEDFNIMDSYDVYRVLDRVGTKRLI